MTEDKYISIRIIDGKPRKVIVDEIGNIANRKPNKIELKNLENEHYVVKNISIREIDKMKEFEITSECINLFNF